MAAGTGFPYVLYDLLKKESSAIVMWTSTGTAFGIRDMAAFRQEVLTCYFKHNKFSSFQRQLNLYGFRKVVKGRESGCYMHPSFLRDCPEKLTEVKRGVVPPCPAHYSRKIYGSGPRFMSQDDGSDSEPELVVQPRGHWDKTLAHSDVATHMKLGEMHVTAAALAAARAHVKGDPSNMKSGQTAAAALAAAHHLQEAQAQLQMHGIPGNGRPPPPSPPHQGMHIGRHIPPHSQEMDIDVGGRLAQHQQQQQQHGMMSRMGSGGGGMYGGDMRGSGASGAANEGPRSRPRGLTKMFGSSRPQMGAGGGSRSSGGMPPPPTSSPFNHSPQRQHLGHPHLQQQLHHQQVHQHQQQHQQMEQQQRYRASAAMIEEQEGGSDGRGPMGSGHMFSPRLPANDGGGQDSGVGMSMGAQGSGGAGEVSDARNPGSGAPGRPGQSSTVASLSKMLEGLEQTLDCPLAEEMYTPIDKRNSFCAQMVNIAQVLEDDPAMHEMEAKSFQGNNNPLTSQIVQKRRSSMSELAAYLSDMLEDGESSRSVATTPGWSLPPPISQNQADYPSSGTGNRGAYKRTLDGEYGSYGAFGMEGTGTSSAAAAAAQTEGAPSAAPGWDGAINRDGGARGNQSSDSPRSNPKRARTNPISAVSASFPSMVSHEGKVGGENGQGREGGAKVAASPNLVQALACLASALPGHSDSEESKDGAEGSGAGKKEKGRVHPGAASGGSADFGDGGGSTASVVVKEESIVGRESLEEATGDAEKQRERGSESGNSIVGRVGNNAINDVLTNFSIDQAIEQLKADDGKDENEAGNRSGDFEEKGLRHRASVYVLMHAIATVNTVNEGDQWGQQDAQEEPLDCPESSVAASI